MGNTNTHRQGCDMQQIAGCDSGDTCPGVFEDGETVIVRGDVVDAITLARADDEAAVRLPRAMLVAAAERLERP
jgi:hypothetical protein